MVGAPSLCHRVLTKSGDQPTSYSLIPLVSSHIYWPRRQTGCSCKTKVKDFAHLYLHCRKNFVPSPSLLFLTDKHGPFHISCAVTCTVSVHTKFHRPNSGSSLVIDIKAKAKCGFHVHAVSLFYYNDITWGMSIV
jgi:hypothetical protein